jgi:hypothetical protein
MRLTIRFENTRTRISPSEDTLHHLKIVERVMGIEPTPSAWKAEVLPLNYTRKRAGFSPLGHASNRAWWRGEDSNLRRLSQQIYSLPPLTAREPLQKTANGEFSPTTINLSILEPAEGFEPTTC